jgi:hypothetical protein
MMSFDDLEFDVASFPQKNEDLKVTACFGMAGFHQFLVI